MPYGMIRTEEDMHRWVCNLLECQAAGTDLPFAVIHLDSGRVAGATRYMEIRLEHREFQRTAVNTESKYLLLRHAFEVLGAIRVQFKADVRNERSWHALERIGANREGILRNHYILPDGVVRDSVYYSIIGQEWPGVKERLEGMLRR
jgi:RimJ/RimL family protein N-acetyltransferase